MEQYIVVSEDKTIHKLIPETRVIISDRQKTLVDALADATKHLGNSAPITNSIVRVYRFQSEKKQPFQKMVKAIFDGSEKPIAEFTSKFYLVKEKGK